MTRIRKKRMISLVGVSFLISFTSILALVKAASVPIPEGWEEMDYQWKCVFSKDDSFEQGDLLSMKLNDSHVTTKDGIQCQAWEVSLYHYDKSIQLHEVIKDEEPFLYYNESESYLSGSEEFKEADLYFLPTPINFEILNASMSALGNSVNVTSPNHVFIDVLDDDGDKEARVELIFEDNGFVRFKKIFVFNETHQIKFLEWETSIEEGKEVTHEKEDAQNDTADDPSSPTLLDNPLLLIGLILLPVLSVLALLVAVKTRERQVPNTTTVSRKIKDIKPRGSRELSVRLSETLHEDQMPKSMINYISSQGPKEGDIPFRNLPKTLREKGILHAKYEKTPEGFRLKCYKTRE